MVKIGSDAGEEAIEEPLAPTPVPAPRVVKKPVVAAPVQPVLVDAPPTNIFEHAPAEPALAAETNKEISIDTLRGLYWLATPDHFGDKKATRGKLKRALNDLLLTKAGMRQFLKSLQEFVFD